MTQTKEGGKPMSNLTITDDGAKIRHEDGTLSDAPSIPFYQYSFLRLRWIPICVKHKLKFKNDDAYYAHWTPVCEQHGARECPPSDYLLRLKGYKWS